MWKYVAPYWYRIIHVFKIYLMNNVLVWCPAYKLENQNMHLKVFVLQYNSFQTEFIFS
jgi:hypothetical protein